MRPESKMKLCLQDGQQKEIQYPGWHKNTTGKELCSGENDEDSKGNRDVWGNVKWGIADRISMPTAVSYSHWWLWHWVILITNN